MPIIDPSHPLGKLLKSDTRYKFEAYVFVFEALNFAHEVLGLGEERPGDEESPPPTKPKSSGRKVERHLSGQELCEAVRRYALEQFGLMAKPVLASWGVRSTSDLGNIVFNLIEIGQMRKTKRDRREDFDNVYDFETAFNDYQIVPPKAQGE